MSSDEMHLKDLMPDLTDKEIYAISLIKSDGRELKLSAIGLIADILNAYDDDLDFQEFVTSYDQAKNLAQKVSKYDVTKRMTLIMLCNRNKQKLKQAI